jgi:hypothetical protein
MSKVSEMTTEFKEIYIEDPISDRVKKSFGWRKKRRDDFVTAYGYINYLKQKRLLFRLYFVICKNFILKKFFIIKILEKLIKY